MDDGIIRLSDGIESLEARAVIGADGVTSRVSRAVGNPSRTVADAGVCRVHHVACERPHETAVIFYLWAGQPGYGYLFPTAEGFCVGVGFLGAAGKRARHHLAELMTLDEHGFRDRFRGTPLWRARRTGLARNAAIALGNSGEPGAFPSLKRALSDPNPMVAEHVRWALDRLSPVT